MIFIETAQIASLQTVLSQRENSPIVDKETFLKNLENFLKQEAPTDDATLNDMLTAEQTTEHSDAIESKELENEIDEEETQALFSTMTFPFIEPALENQKFVQTHIQGQTVENVENVEIPEEITADIPEINLQAETIDIKTEEMLDTQNIIQREKNTHVLTEGSDESPQNFSNKVEDKLISKSVEDSPGEKEPAQVKTNQKLIKTDQPSGRESSSVSNRSLEENIAFDLLNPLKSSKDEPINLKFTQEDLEAFEEVNTGDTAIKQEIKQEPSSTPSTENIFILSEQQSQIVENNVQLEPIQRPKEQWASTVEQMVIEQVQTAEGKKITTTQIQLTPEYLGKMDVELTIENRELLVKINVEQMETKQWLESQLTTLTNTLATQDISVVSIQVDVTPAFSNPFTFEQQQQASQEQKTFDRRPGKTKKYTKDSIEETEISPSTINTARGVSLWA